MGWQPLSGRQRGAAPDGPFEGVPDHLRPALLRWIEVTIRESPLVDADALAQVVLLKLRLPQHDRSSPYQSLMLDCSQGEPVLLDAIDCILSINPGDATGDHLDYVLEQGGSVWSVAASGLALERRVGESQRDAAALAMMPGDEAATELAQAWSETYGRQPNPSDAWDHAIKAVEAVAIPAICPRKDNANLGSVAGQLKGQPEQFWFALGDVATVESMLRRIWVNPDRHGGGSDRRDPTQVEAEAVLILAVTLVQWFRTGAIRKKDT